jgi:hypothetical protein
MMAPDLVAAFVEEFNTEMRTRSLRGPGDSCRQAVNTLARVMRGQTGTKSSPTPESVRVAACNSILDRAYGRLAQTVDFDVNEALEIVYRSPEEILEEIKRRQLGPVLEIAARSVDTTDVVDSGGNDDNNGS